MEGGEVMPVKGAEMAETANGSLALTSSEWMRRLTVPRRGTVGSTLARQLRLLQGDRPVAAFARAVRCNAESFRRYLRGGTLPSAVLADICKSEGVSADWLLLGRGFAHWPPVPEEVLPLIPTDALMAEVGRRMLRLETPRRR